MGVQGDPRSHEAAVAGAFPCAALKFVGRLRVRRAFGSPNGPKSDRSAGAKHLAVPPGRSLQSSVAFSPRTARKRCYNRQRSMQLFRLHLFCCTLIRASHCAHQQHQQARTCFSRPHELRPGTFAPCRVSFFVRRVSPCQVSGRTHQDNQMNAATRPRFSFLFSFFSSKNPRKHSRWYRSHCPMVRSANFRGR